MDTRLQNQLKAPSPSPVSPKQTGLFQSRPFAEPEQEEGEALGSSHQPPDLQTQLDRASRFGHDFSRVQVQPHTPAVIQPQQDIGGSQEQEDKQDAQETAEPVKPIAPPLGRPIQREATEEEPIQMRHQPGFLTALVQRESQEEEPIQMMPQLGLLAPMIQREATEEEPIQMMPQWGMLQRSTSEEDEAPIQMMGWLQPKVVVGAPGDKYEQEADSVAAQVMSMNAPSANTGLVQPQAEEEQQEPLVQRTPLADSITPLVQRQSEEPEQALQPKSLLQRAGAKSNSEAGSGLENKLTSSKGGGSPLPDNVRSFMEPRFGTDFSSVRVHTDSSAVQMNKELGAQAFTHGSNIYYGAGKSPAQDSLTAHELTHVVQQVGAVQRQRRVDQQGNKAAVSNSLSSALIQRKEPPNASMPEPQVSTPGSTSAAPEGKKPPAPGGSVVLFEGVQLSANSEFLRHQLEQMVVAKGEAATDAFAYRFINMTAEQKIQLQLSGYDPKLVEEIQIYLKEEILRLEYDNKEFIKQFEQKAIAITNELLNNSEQQIKKELEHYGITSQEIQFGENSRTEYSMSNKEAGKGLQSAASELAKKRRDVDKVAIASIQSREKVEKFAKDNPFLIPENLTKAAEQERLEWLKQEDEYHNLCMQKQNPFPILASYSTGSDAAQRLEQLTATPPDQMAQSIGEQAQEKLKNIQTVRGELGKRFSVWKQPHIMNIAKQQMNATSMQSRVISDAATKIQAAAEDSKMLFAILAVGLGLLAAIPTGGSSALAGIAAAAAVVGAGVSAYGAYEHLQEYTLESAANGTDFDKAKAISQDEPSMLWLALDLVGAGLDIYGAATAFKTIKVAIQGAKESGDIVTLARQIEQAAPGAKKTILPKVIAQATAAGDVEKMIVKVGDQSRIADSIKVGQLIEEVVGEAWHDVYLNMLSSKKIRPLTEDELFKALEHLPSSNPEKYNNLAEEYIIKDLVLKTAGGIYCPQTKLIFVKPGSEEYVSMVVIHEMTHALQAKEGAKFYGFAAEFEAHVAQRRFLQELAKLPDRAIPPNWEWLAKATDEQLKQHITKAYGFKFKDAYKDLEGEKLAQQAFERAKRF